MAPNKSSSFRGAGLQTAAIAAPAPDLSLDDMLKISRQKTEHEKFAQRIFGRDRRSSAPGALSKRSKTTDAVPTLASRVGVQKKFAEIRRNEKLADLRKRTTKSSTNLKRDAQKRHPRPSQLQHSLTIDEPGSLASRIGARPNAQRHSPIPPPAPVPPKASLSIRGLAGPVTVMAQNFAPGTTAADIRSAFEPVGGEMLSCRLRSSAPTVIAEMIFVDRDGAEAVVETFNNQKADGRLLYVYLQAGAGSNMPDATARGGSDREYTSSGNRIDRDRNRQDYQDGRYGFDDQDEDMDAELDQPSHPSEQESARYDRNRRDERAHDDYDSRANGSGTGSGGYRSGRRDNGRYDRGNRQERPLYSDRYRDGRGHNGAIDQGRGWR